MYARERTATTRTERHNSPGSRWTRWYGPQGDGSVGGVYHSYRTPVMVRMVKEGVVVRTTARYSVTTAKHISHQPFGYALPYVYANEEEIRELARFLDARARGSRKWAPKWLRDRIARHHERERRRRRTVGPWRLSVDHHRKSRGKTWRAGGSITHASRPDERDGYWNREPSGEITLSWWGDVDPPNGDVRAALAVLAEDFRRWEAS